MHPVRLRCKNSEYPDIPTFLRLAGRAPQLPKLRIYYFVNPKHNELYQLLTFFHWAS